MTALKDYARLETTGLWRADVAAQRREVYVAFGDATLVISDSSGRPLAHWSLAAVTRLNPGAAPALFGASPDADETLEIADTDMIDAIAQVQRAIDRARPRPGRLRWMIMAGSAAGLLWLGVFWLPGALIDHAVKVAPDVKRQEIGAALLARAARLTGQPCDDPFGMVALARLEATLAPESDFHILRDGIARSASLPGGHVLLSRTLLEDHDSVSVVAGFAVAEVTRARLHDPLRQMLDTMGPLSAFHLLTSGEIPAEALDTYAEALLTAPPADVPYDALLLAFEERALASSPYAYALDVTGETTLTLIEADPLRGEAPATLLSDGEWLSLQAICAR